MIETLTSEQERAIFNDWIAKISDRGEVGVIDREIVFNVLVSLGANPEISEEAKVSLSKYGNKFKRKGLDAVWGSEKVTKLKGWIKGEFIPQCERKYGLRFPTLYDPDTQKYDSRLTNNTNYSGSLQFAGELTAFGFGILDTGIFREHTKRRAEKGFEWKKREYKPSRNHPFPPGFPSALVDKLTQLKR